MKKKVSFKIQRKDFSIQGHSGIGRFKLIGRRVTKDKLTSRMAAEFIGRSILCAYNDFCYKNNIDYHKRGVNVSITFEDYELDE